MDWLIFSIISSMFWAVGVVIDKYTLTKHMQDPFSYQLLYTITEAPILLLLLFTSISFAFPWFALGIIGGLGTYLGFILYFKAMAIEEASRVISLIYISPIFVLILASVFLEETLSLPMYFDVAFLVLGATSISYRKSKWRKLYNLPCLGTTFSVKRCMGGIQSLDKIRSWLYMIPLISLLEFRWDFDHKIFVVLFPEDESQFSKGHQKSK